MSNNIAYFSTLGESQSYTLPDVPWIGYIEEGEILLWSKKLGQLVDGQVQHGGVVALRGTLCPGEGDDRWQPANQIVLANDDSETTASRTIYLSTGTYEFKVVENGVWRSATSNGKTTIGTLGYAVACSSVGGVDNNLVIRISVEGEYTFNWNYQNDTISVQRVVVIPNTVYFVNNNHWETPYVYAFTEDLHNADWPGQLISEIGTLSEPFDGYTVYSIKVDSQYSNIIFNNGMDSYQTSDLSITNEWYYNTESESGPAPTLPTYSVIGNCNICNKPWIEDDNSAMSRVSAGIYVWEHDRVHICKEAPAEYQILRRGGEWVGSSSRTIQLGESDPKGWYKVTITLNVSTLEVTTEYELMEEDKTLANYVLATAIDWNDQVEMQWNAEGTSLQAVLPISEQDIPDSINFIIKTEGDGIYVKGAIINRQNCTLRPLNENTIGDGNSVLIADAAGDYTITYYPSEQQISVTYPETPDYDLMFMYIGDNPVPRILIGAEGVYSNTLTSMSQQPVRFELNQTQYYLTSSVNADTNGIPIALTTEYTDSTISVPNGAVISVNGSTDCTVSWETPEAKLYFKPNSNWVSADARFTAYFFGNGEAWISMTSVSDGVYEAEIPDGYTGVIFCRMNPSTTENNWDSKWNQTNDLTIPTDGNDFYILDEGGWDYGSGAWSTYVAPSSD